MRHLFNHKRFHQDKQSDYFIANVPLRLSKQQWELLVESDIDGLNLNEIDSLLEDVLKQSNDEDYLDAQVRLERYCQQLVESLPSWNSPSVMIIIAIAAAVVVAKTFNFSKLTFSALILFGFLGICAVSYSMTYYDCLSDLEVEQMLQLSHQQSANNPCKDYAGEHSSFMSSMLAKAFGSSENKCLEHMRKTFKPSKKFCDPLDVFAKWFGKIQMSYFTSVFGGFFELLTSFTSSSNFLTKTILWATGVAALVYLAVSLGKSFIKHSFRGFFGMVTTTRVTTEPPSDPIHDFRLLSSKMDTILHENQEMKRELSFIRECSVERQEKSSPQKIEGISRLPHIDEESPAKGSKSE